MVQIGIFVGSVDDDIHDDGNDKKGTFEEPVLAFKAALAPSDWPS